MEKKKHIRLHVNGVEHELEIAPQAKLADVLRHDLGLTGVKIGCGDGQCGTCVVLLDGRPVRACIYPARRAVGKKVLTIEGLAASWGDPGALHPLQRAFIDHGAVQCGFCTPGMLMAAAALWNKMVASSFSITDKQIKRALARHACRCTGYASVLRAMRSAVHEHQSGEPLPPIEIETVAPLHVIGHSHARPDVVDKVTGATRFSDDYCFPRMLHGKTLRAAHPHARILSIDVSQARALPGVHAVLTHEDVPGLNRHGLIYQDWPVLCDDKVRYLGDAVALVAADTPAIAAQALKLIQVEYEVLPVVSDAEQARQADAPLVHEDCKSGNLLRHIEVRHGDVEQGLAEADVLVEREYRTPMIEHMFLEPECSIGVPAGHDVREPTRLSSSQAQSNDAQHPKLTVYAGSQIPYDDRAQIAAAMNLPPEKVRVIGAFIGGAFGGKEDIAGQIHAALLAQATGRPVKILYDRAESMLVHPKRHATIIRIKTGAKKDGTLTAIQAELIGDAGAYASLSPKVLARTTTHATGPYQVPHVSIDCYAMYTNNPPAGAFRGFGVPQSAFAAESNMDILAHELGLDPFALRRKNALRIGSTTVTGQTLKDSVGMIECLDWVESRVKAHPLQSPIPLPPALRAGASGSAPGTIVPSPPGASPRPIKTPAWAGARTMLLEPRSRSIPTARQRCVPVRPIWVKGCRPWSRNAWPRSWALPTSACAFCSPTPTWPPMAGLPLPAARPISPATPPAWPRAACVIGSLLWCPSDGMSRRTPSLSKTAYCGPAGTRPQCQKWSNGSRKKGKRRASPTITTRQQPGRWGKGAICTLPLAIASRRRW